MWKNIVERGRRQVAAQCWEMCRAGQATGGSTLWGNVYSGAGDRWQHNVGKCIQRGWPQVAAQCCVEKLHLARRTITVSKQKKRLEIFNNYCFIID